MEAVVTVGLALLMLGAGIAFGIYFNKKVTTAKMGDLDQLLAEKTKKAEDESEKIRQKGQLDASNYLIEAKKELEKETKQAKGDLAQKENFLFQKEEKLNKKAETQEKREEDFSKREELLNTREKQIAKKGDDAERLLTERKEELERVAGMTTEEAKQTLKDGIEAEAKLEAAKKVKQIEDEAKDTAQAKANNIIALAIQRYAGEYATERIVTVVGLPNDEMKGRLIGREGRNIRALEAATGIDLIIDDTPEAIVLSGFDPIRREVARMSIDRLIQDGRIHPSRIEEMVTKCQVELDEKIKEFGQQATFDLGLHGVHQEIVKLIGRLRWRTSYTQNVWQHSIEVGYICGVMAAELGLPVKKARRAGLLHDIGKAVTHEIEGSHAVIGAELARKFGEKEDIVHAIEAHHEDVEPSTILAHLVQAADCLSGARPGARREIMESYVQRLKDLEHIATSHNGVERSFAIQAGREVRVMVNAGQISDTEAVVLSGDIAKQIETELTYPGEIKVVVIRETRAVGVAH